MKHNDPEPGMMKHLLDCTRTSCDAEWVSEAPGILRSTKTGMLRMFPHGRGGEDLGAGAKSLKPWDEWKEKVDAIAKAEGLTPKDNLLPGELETWLRQWKAGKTPAQAWHAVPYRNEW